VDTSKGLLADQTIQLTGEKSKRGALPNLRWVAMCVYLILAYLKFLSKASTSMQHVLQLLQLSLFMRRDLVALLRNDPTEPIPITPQRQLALAW